MARGAEHTCPKHPMEVLVCLKCLGAKGGRKTARRHGHKQMRKWGKMGGRPAKKSRKKRKR